MAHGVNAMMCRKLGLEGMQVLRPATETLAKVVTFVPQGHSEVVRNAMFAAGGGQIGHYDECSFNLDGEGTFRAGEGARPFVGQLQERHHEGETRIEMVVERWNVRKVISAMKAAHPYEEVAHDVVMLDNAHPTAGSGGIGTFAEPIAMVRFRGAGQISIRCTGRSPHKSAEKGRFRRWPCAAEQAVFCSQMPSEREQMCSFLRTSNTTNSLIQRAGSPLRT